jgi:hypothetical protein
MNDVHKDLIKTQRTNKEHKQLINKQEINEVHKDLIKTQRTNKEHK